jgi:hypothetical protein
MMSKLRELLTEDRTMRQVQGRFRPPVVIELQEMSQPMEFDVRSEYKLTLRVETHFICNTAEHEHARGNAEAQLQYHLFHTVIAPLREAMSAIYAGQESEAMQAVQRALNECTR